MSLYIRNLLYLLISFPIGKSGLNELITLDNRFEKFADTLFNETTLYFQRTVETKQVNEEIDIQIKELFYHLIPYFQLRPAHCILEWLIVRYNKFTSALI